MPAQRIDKILSSAGFCSRREASALVRRGAVAVDGVVCRDAAAKVDPERVRIAVDGTELDCRTNVYLMLHKPLGVVSATKDRDEKTVLDLLPLRYQKMGVFPVGRLDKDTDGLLLLTSDGAFGHRLTSPRHDVQKVYRAQIAGELSPDAAQRFAAGLTLRDGTLCRPAQLEILSAQDGVTHALVTVREGKYHQVRRMVAACGGRVVRLTRIREGALELDRSLEPGQWRELTEQERALLLRDASCGTA